MKQFAYLALLGLISNESIQAVKLGFRPNSYQQPWSAPAKAGPDGIVATGYNVQDKGAIFYDRVTPEIYSQPSDDLLMRSLIQNYAIEGRTDDEPNGDFVLSKAGALSVAKEVVGTHFGWSGEQRDDYAISQLKEYWPTQDQLSEGFIPVSKGAVLMKQIIGEVEMNNKLQVQLEDEVAVPDETTVQFRPNAVQQPWSAKAPAGPTGKIVNAFEVADKNSYFYDRVTPENFANKDDDLFMRSIIQNYAVEGNSDSDPNGHFYLKRDGAVNVAKEIVGSHFGWTGEKRDNFANQKLDELWGNYDVNGEGFIDVQRGPPLFRTLLGEVEIGNKLQMQTQEDMNLGGKSHFRPNEIQQPWSVKDKSPATGKIVGAYQVADKGAIFYDRQIPENFKNGDDDLLMRSLITNYAVEGKKDQEPNGKFYLTKDDAESVAKEVVTTHFGWQGEKRDQYVKQRMGEFWPNHDVNKEGFIDAEQGPVLLKSILGEVELNNKLQVQTVQDLRKHQGHHKHHHNRKADKLALQNGAEVVYRPDPILSPWAVKEADKPKPTAITGAFQNHSHGSIFYNRVVPDNFTGEKADMLMNSLLKEYSLEGKDKKTGLPNGKFFINKINADHVANEVVRTHLQMTQEQANKYEKEHFPAIWDHFDILKQGFIETERAPMMMRAVVGEVEAQGGLQ